MDITVVGSLNMDIVAVVDHMPGAGETVKTASAQLYSGGKGANQAVAAARQGARVRMVGAVGGDAFGESICMQLVKSGVGIEGVFTKDAPSGVALITVERDGQNRIVVCEGANALLAPDDVERACGADPLPPGSAMLLQNEIPRATVVHAIRLAHRRGWRVVWNVAPVERIPAGLLTNRDIIAVNEKEASMLVGFEVIDDQSARKAAEQLLAIGPGLVIVTLGDLGSLALSPDFGVIRIPAFSVPVVDTTAAGDTFIGVFAADWDGVQSPELSLRKAAAAAALCVSRRGAQSSIPTREETETFLRQHA
ncbi:PfkB domain protein [Alicyclobacillus acidocaldarius subsp. acidocaldarius DSM 446]|uniref:Ribokinase n=1 Tax=Alicyclobacillus acidocaldarius subsp. acidocaldarius (strain ATCC 27009 / DSM 446 / BCRC 14685 / JCM 5260 / KCTC 1825 / NBRC 15652 / NCIMB 11725 / NRRL B-14509 / 104-IA) TaxID=521098 RepID=C8WRM4_ALIAD|nr:ribokinase [Alicyclobacillus acidocaldarius]ACV59285.1 PfkB domain protein [Alicyclobacillus acidocaldarius subsp. acidocaldarius DSM 446]